MTTDFDRLKEICRIACHERNACEAGYRDLMAAENIQQLLHVWRRHWHDIYQSKFCDVMAEHIVRFGKRMESDFRANDVFVNISSDRGLVIVCNPMTRISVGGHAACYVFGDGCPVITATDHARVYSRLPQAHIKLLDHAIGTFEGGRIDCCQHALARGTFDCCQCSGPCSVECSGGIVVDRGHRLISASGSAVVYSDLERGVSLYEDAIMQPMAQYQPDNDA